MDRSKAKRILQEQMSDLFQLSYAQLFELMRSEQPLLRSVERDSCLYQIEIEVRWDGMEQHDIRICGAIDAGGILPSIFPTCFDFVVTPDGERIIQN